jgi:hypothetical protein
MKIMANGISEEIIINGEAVVDSMKWQWRNHLAGENNENEVMAGSVWQNNNIGERRQP